MYDSDRFRWEGQLDKWLRLYPWIFARQMVPISKSQRRASVSSLLNAIESAAFEGRKPPKEKVNASMNERVNAKIGVGGSRETDTRGAVETAHRGMLARLEGRQPSLLVAAFTCTHEASEVGKLLHELSPTVPMIGCTSCRGVVLNDTWLTYQKEWALGLWGVCDDAGSYSVIHIQERPPVEDLRDAVFSKVASIAKQMDEKPSFVVLLGSPGDEEIILDGLQAAVGKDVPVLGGSSADNSVAGMWRQIACEGSSNYKVAKPTVSGSGISIAVGWASCQVRA